MENQSNMSISGSVLKNYEEKKSVQFCQKSVKKYKLSVQKTVTRTQKPQGKLRKNTDLPDIIQNP